VPAIAGRGYPNRPIITRGTLQDDPQLTTAAPIVVLDVQRRVLHRDQLSGRAFVARATLVDVIVADVLPEIVLRQRIC
jgi:hypothetical protein